MKDCKSEFDLLAAIKRGKCFTRDGQLVLLTSVVCDEFPFPVRGIIAEPVTMLSRHGCWTLDGYYLVDDPECLHNLVNERTEDDE